MKRTFTLFLLLLLCLLSCMAPLRYGLKQAARVVMELRMEGQADKNALVLIAANSIDKDEWEGKREFRKEGILYDVSDSVSVGGKTYYQCINDELEVRLENDANRIACSSLGLNHDNSRNKLASSLMDWLQGFYLRPLSTLSEPFACKDGGTWHTGPVHFAKNPYLDNGVIPPEA